MAEELETTDKDKLARGIQVLKSGLSFDPDTYEFDDSFVPMKGTNPLAAHTTMEMVKCLESKRELDIDAEVLVVKRRPGKGRKKSEIYLESKRMGKKEFLQHFKKNDKVFSRMKEDNDVFATDGFEGVSNLVGQDFIPLLGGPFNKQLYLHDYQRMQALAFHAYHHDPIARRAVHIVRDFTLGRGFRVDSENKIAVAIWKTFEEVNDLYQHMDHVSVELSLYGEVMPWWLPNNDTFIVEKLPPGEMPPKGIIPRVRLMDPSMVWEIVTYPEDITRVLYYQVVSPTQYQIYSGRYGDAQVPSLKFIYKQIPAEEMMHFKVNSVSNEKRGRSDLFPVFGYMKRLRDSVNYSIISLQKAAAWSIDTEIQGSQQDITNYINDQKSQGTIAPAGSEFVHTNKIKREYLSNDGASRGQSSGAFDWTLSMIASGLGLPISYFGTHLSGGLNRASAIVATEPTAKLFEKRQLVYERILNSYWTRLFQSLGWKEIPECKITFPEIITQDRSAKLKDLAMAEMSGWINKKTAATIAAKELEITNYDFTKEFEDEDEEDDDPSKGATVQPLSLPGLMNGGQKPDPNASFTGEQRKKVKSNNGF